MLSMCKIFKIFFIPWSCQCVFQVVIYTMMLSKCKTCLCYTMMLSKCNTCLCYTMMLSTCNTCLCYTMMLSLCKNFSDVIYIINLSIVMVYLFCSSCFVFLLFLWMICFLLGHLYNLSGYKIKVGIHTFKLSNYLWV